TALLAVVYVALLFEAPAAVSALTGQRGDQPPVSVVSTLLVLALATLLRRAVQVAIDRRFYRRTYNAERMLAAFGQTLRQAVDLEQRVTRLVVVEETMRPAHVAHWLRPPKDHGEREPRRAVDQSIPPAGDSVPGQGESPEWQLRARRPMLGNRTVSI